MDLESARIADLRADATDAFFEAAISIAMSAVGPLGEAAAIARSLAALRFELRVLTRHDVEKLAAAVFPLLGVIHGLARYAQDISEIADIQERLQEYHDDSVNLGLDLLALTELAQDDGCLDPATS